MMYQKPQLSVGEKIALCCVIFRTVATFLSASLTGLLQTHREAPTYKTHVLYSALRTITANATIRESQ